jgi:hypothetical protein
MLERLRKSLERASIEDKIVFFRFMVGLFYGIGVYASSLFINHLELSEVCVGVVDNSLLLHSVICKCTI